MKNADIILWDKLRAGDKNAFDKIFYKYVNVLYNYGKKYTNNVDLVEDCIQDLFTDLWAKRNNIGSTNHIKPYLLLAIKRRILRQVSKEKKNFNLDHVNEFYLEFSTEEKMIQESSSDQNIERLNRMLTKLTPKQKEVIYLKFFEQLSYAEIAKIMKVEIKAIYKLISRAINSLKSDFVTFLLFC